MPSSGSDEKIGIRNVWMYVLENPESITLAKQSSVWCLQWLLMEVTSSKKQPIRQLTTEEKMCFQNK